MQKTHGEKIVYIPMCADIVHAGHLNIIKEGAKRGSVVIGLLTDSAVAAKKRLPYMDYEQRYEVISNIKGVDRVIPQDTPDYRPNLRELKPAFVVHGDDWRPEAKRMVTATLDEWGGVLVEVAYTEGISSTQVQGSIKRAGITPQRRLKQLGRLLDAKDIVRVLEAHDGLSALVVENATRTDSKGIRQVFDAIWVSSLTDSLAKGKPDTEVVDRTSRLATIGEIIDVTTKPLIVDGDTGGHIEHFVYLVSKLEQLGVSAVVIEDKTGFKRNSLYGTPSDHSQESPERFAAKIKAGVGARHDDDFMIIARIESLILGKSVDEALKRAETYIKAGADAIMIHSKLPDGSDAKAFAAAYGTLPDHRPLMMIPTSYPDVSERELGDWGADIVVYANHLIRAAYPAMQQAAQSILEHSRAKEAEAMLTPVEELLQVIPDEHAQA